MARLKWGEIGTKKYKVGVKNGVLYPAVSGAYPKGVSWPGLTKVTESPSGAEPTSLYADDAKYLSLMSAEDFGCTIEGYYSPEEFDECDGTAEIAEGVRVSQQTRKPFGFCYRTGIGNDSEGAEYGYELHLVYGALASPSSKDNSTVNESPEVSPLSWEVKTTPVPVPNKKPTAHLIIDSTKIDAEKLAKLEDILYGKDGVDGAEGTDARLPLPAEIITILAEA